MAWLGYSYQNNAQKFNAVGLEIWTPCTGLVVTRVVSITCLSSVLGTSGLFHTVFAPLAQMICSEKIWTNKRLGQRQRTKRGNDIVTSVTTRSNDLYDTKCNVPVKPAHPRGQSPGIWPKMRTARWGIWLSCQNVCKRSETKGCRNSLIQHLSCVDGSLLLSIPREFFCCCRFI